jgi:hypothetical protein
MSSNPRRALGWQLGEILFLLACEPIEVLLGLDNVGHIYVIISNHLGYLCME